MTHHRLFETAAVVLLVTCGCAHRRMQDNAAQVADAVTELRADVERQQLIRTELARSGVERLARAEAELAHDEAARAAGRAHSDPAVEGLVRHSKAVSEGADPRFAETIASEVERRETTIEYQRHVDELESLRALLERLSVGVVRGEIELYLELGAAAADAAKAEWTQAQAEE
jgi:hypothetical protein